MSQINTDEVEIVEANIYFYDTVSVSDRVSNHDVLTNVNNRTKHSIIPILHADRDQLLNSAGSENNDESHERYSCTAILSELRICKIPNYETGTSPFERTLKRRG